MGTSSVLLIVNILVFFVFTVLSEAAAFRTWGDVNNCALDHLEKCHEKCAPLIDNSGFSRSLLNCELNESLTINDAHRSCLNRNGFAIVGSDSQCWAPYNDPGYNETAPQTDLIRRRRSRRFNVGSPSQNNATLSEDTVKLMQLSESLVIYTNCFRNCSSKHIQFGMCRRGCKHPTDPVQLQAFVKCGVAGRNKGDKRQYNEVYKALQAADACVLNELYAHSKRKTVKNLSQKRNKN